MTVTKKTLPPDLFAGTPEASRDAIAMLKDETGWSFATLAKALGYADRQVVRKQLDGPTTMPRLAWAVLLLLADRHPTFRLVRRKKSDEGA